jgi:hypothetical protein
MSRDNSALSQDNRKKIEQYSYCLNDRIGKGYFSVVYRDRNDESSMSIFELTIAAGLSFNSLFRMSDETVAIKVIDMKSIRDAISKEML